MSFLTIFHSKNVEGLYIQLIVAARHLVVGFQCMVFNKDSEYLLFSQTHRTHAFRHHLDVLCLLSNIKFTYYEEVKAYLK